MARRSAMRPDASARLQLATGDFAGRAYVHRCGLKERLEFVFGEGHHVGLSGLQNATD